MGQTTPAHCYGYMCIARSCLEEHLLRIGWGGGKNGEIILFTLGVGGAWDLSSDTNKCFYQKCDLNIGHIP